jgi:hypothetical protein
MDGVERFETRRLFAELVAGAVEATRVEPSPLATAYLVDLLDARVRAVPLPRDADGAEETLAEGLLAARLERGEERRRRLRALGDRALFVSGFFGDSLTRRLCGISYYGDAGRMAYAGLSGELARALAERTWAELFEELADRFEDFIEVLTEVGDRTRLVRDDGLAWLATRVLDLGDPRDRRRLARRGLAVIDPPDGESFLS